MFTFLLARPAAKSNYLRHRQWFPLPKSTYCIVYYCLFQIPKDEYQHEGGSVPAFTSTIEHQSSENPVTIHYPFQNPKDEDQHQGDSVPVSTSTRISEHQSSEKPLTKSDVPITLKWSSQYRRLEKPASELSPSHDHPPETDSEASELSAEQHFQVAMPGHSQYNQHQLSETMEGQATKLRSLSNPSPQLEPKPAEPGIFSGSTTEEMLRSHSASHQLESELETNKHEIRA